MSNEAKNTDEFVATHESLLKSARVSGDNYLLSQCLAELGSYYYSGGYYQKAAYCYEELLHVTPSFEESKVASILEVLAFCHYRNNEFDKTTASVERLLSFYRPYVDEDVRCELLGILGWSYVNVGQFALGAQYLESALERSRRLGDIESQLRASDCLGFAYSQVGDFEKAIPFYHEAIRISRELGRKQQLAEYLLNLGACIRSTADSASARLAFEEAAAVSRDISDGALLEKAQWALLDTEARLDQTNRQGTRVQQLLRSWQKKIEFSESSWAVLEEIDGGMGKIFFVVEAHGKPIACAIKVIHPDIVRNWEQRQRFLQEARIWLELRLHPNIVSLDSIRELNGQFYMFIELIIGPEHQQADLRNWCGRDELGLDDYLRYAIGIVDGLAYAKREFEERGIDFVHLDLKPSNILISEDGNAKITDFGIARLVYTQPAKHPLGNTVETSRKWVYPLHSELAGTWAYMSPEQCYGDDVLDSRSDIYSLGCVLYEMLTGEQLFKALDPQTYIYIHHNVEPNLHKVRDSKFPPEVADIIDRCCQKDRRERYQTLENLREALENIYKKIRGVGMPRPVTRERPDTGLFNKALSLIELDEPQRAITILDSLLARNPRDKKSLTHKGIALKRMQRYSEALECVERALAIDPDYVGALVAKGLLLDELGRTEEALEPYDQVIGQDKFSATAWNNKGNALARIGRLQEALNCHERALELKPDYLNALCGKCGDLLMLLELASARECLEQIKRLAPDDKRTKELEKHPLLAVTGREG